MAILLFYKKEATEEGDIIEQKVWKVDKSNDFPKGIKYSFVYIHNNEKILGYDNERGKDHHKHYFNKETGYKFVDLIRLFNDFELDIEKIRGALYGKKEN